MSAQRCVFSDYFYKTVSGIVVSFRGRIRYSVDVVGDWVQLKLSHRDLTHREVLSVHAASLLLALEENLPNPAFEGNNITFYCRFNRAIW